jgi:hypothetical protein
LGAQAEALGARGDSALRADAAGALQLYDDALAVRPDDAGLHRKRSAALRALGRLREAELSAATAVALDDSHRSYWIRAKARELAGNVQVGGFWGFLGSGLGFCGGSWGFLGSGLVAVPFCSASSYWWSCEQLRRQGVGKVGERGWGTCLSVCAHSTVSLSCHILTLRLAASHVGLGACTSARKIKLCLM